MTGQGRDDGPDAVISVVMPARNAGETIAQTLDSLIAQTRQAWRVIVVDDGSTDSTRAICEEFAAKDARISVIDGPQRGNAAAARNAALAHVDGEWLLFLDSDDLLDPDMMARMMATLAANPDADAVHCGWRYVDPQGQPISVIRCEETGADLFPIFARYCAIAIHTCIFRRSLLDEAGGFDESLTTCEDFDLWQRMARIGARFVPLNAHLVSYRLRPNLTWFDAEPFLSNCLEVVRRGHNRDPRLNDVSVPAHRQHGADALHQISAEINVIVLSAGHQIAQGRDATALLDHLPPEGYPLADSKQPAYTLLHAIPLALCRPRSAWLDLWPEMEPQLVAFLTALERKTGATGLANRTMTLLGSLIAGEFPDAFRGGPAIRHFGNVAAAGVDISHEINDIEVGRADRLVCVIFHQGVYLGTITLPAFDGHVPAIVLKDAIADRFVWQLLERLFSAQIYPRLSVERKGAGWAISRGDILLASGLAADPVADGGLHDQVGWTVFIQELTGLADWSSSALYNPALASPNAPVLTVSGDAPVAIECSSPIPDLSGISGDMVDVEVRVGGAPMFLTRVLAKNGKVASGALRVAILDRGKMELARFAVREGLVSVEGDAETPLAARLRHAAQGRATLDIGQTVSAHCLAMGSVRSGDLAENLRTAALPSDLAGMIREARQAGQPLIEPDGKAATCLYLPELMTRAAPDAALPVQTSPGGITGRVLRVFDGLRRRGAIPSGPTTARLPILMYHAVADTGPEALSRWRVTCEMFDAHLRHLKQQGYTPATFDEWRRAREAGQPLPGRRVIITFDDAYVDFEQNALPILRKHGFPAVLFVPTGKVGKTADWDAWTGDPLPLMDWDGLRRMRDAGIEIGSHSVSHPHLTGLSPTQMAEELLHSRLDLKRELGVEATAIAYPSGSYDEIVMHLTGACGYRHAVTTDDRMSAQTDGNFALARIEVMGEQSLEAFIKRLAA